MFPVAPSHDPRAALIQNEGIKLTATYINNLAASVFAVGGLAPIFSVLYSNTSAIRPISVLSISVVCWFASTVLHVVARRILAKMVKP